MKKNKIIVHSVHSIDEILPLIVKKKRHKSLISWFMINTNSLRLQVFKRSITCIKCGVKWHHFNLESRTYANNWIPHLNLYTKNWVLMTKDHTIPKSKNWKDHLSNLEAMCVYCNNKKWNTIS